jgi:hypothetical protein
MPSARSSPVHTLGVQIEELTAAAASRVRGRAVSAGPVSPSAPGSSTGHVKADWWLRWVPRPGPAPPSGRSSDTRLDFHAPRSCLRTPIGGAHGRPPDRRPERAASRRDVCGGKDRRAWPDPRGRSDPAPPQARPRRLADTRVVACPLTRSYPAAQARA